LRQVLETGQGLELQPGGTGARQLRLLYEELGIGDNGSLLVEPLPGGETVQGLLLLGRGQGYHQWPATDAVLAQPVAAYLGQVLFRLRQLTALGERPLLPLPDSDLAPAGRLITLEEERNRLATELEVAQNRARQAERRAAEARKQAEDLATTVEAFEAIQPQTTPTQVTALEGELESLRESLMVAEEAMAMAAASEGGLSTEWIMMTITRYSGQLEEAQAQIQKLQQELDQRNREGSSQIVAALAQELRTPMTSISGYADLLLNGSAGLLGSRQRDFLQRVRANVERMDALINQLVQLTSGEQTGDSSESTVTTDLPAVMDTAVQSVLSQVREKKLQLDLDLKIDDWLPPIAVPHNVLQQILNHLLHNACRSSHQQTYVTLQVQAHELSDPAGHDKSTRFLHIAIRDSGDGIHVDDRARVFDPQYQADDPLIAGVGDTGAGLAMAHSLATAHGGRMWVDSQPGEGSTFSVLFPLGYRSGVEEVADPHLLSRNGQEDG
jgi:signal transduction histidine kinase